MQPPVNPPPATLLVDESGTVISATDPACELLGYDSGELDGQCVEVLMPERFRLVHIGMRLRFTDQQRTRPMGSGLLLRAVRKDGAEIGVDISLMPIRRGLQTLILLAIQARETIPQVVAQA
jgi:protein-histidine pros-kinase